MNDPFPRTHPQDWRHPIGFDLSIRCFFYPDSVGLTRIGFWVSPFLESGRSSFPHLPTPNGYLPSACCLLSSSPSFLQNQFYDVFKEPQPGRRDATVLSSTTQIIVNLVCHVK